MRRLLPLAPLAALALLAPASASAASCTPPKVHGFDVYALHETEIGCHYADGIVLHWFRSGTPSGYTCRQRVSGRNVQVTCTQHERAHAGATFSYRVH